jgi:hypothetical protein
MISLCSIILLMPFILSQSMNSVWLKIRRFGVITGFIGHLQFLITIQANSISYTVQFTTHALSLLSLLSLTSHLVPASNGGRSPSWVLELSQCHDHSNY